MCVCVRAISQIIAQLLAMLKTQFYPSNSGRWSGALGSFVSKLAALVTARTGHEARGIPSEIAAVARLPPHTGPLFCEMLYPLLLQSVYSQQAQLSFPSSQAIRYMAQMCPRLILTDLWPRMLQGEPPRSPLSSFHRPLRSSLSSFFA